MVVSFLVNGNEIHEASEDVLMKHEESYLAALVRAMKRGMFVETSGEKLVVSTESIYFGLLLEYMTHGVSPKVVESLKTMNCMEKCRLRAEADFFGVCRMGKDLSVLGFKYRNGLNVTRNKDLGNRYFLFARELGDLVGKGLCFREGFGCVKDKEKSFECFKQAAMNGCDLGQTYLGIAFNLGTGVEKNVEEAVCWYQKAVDGGNPVAMHNLAYCYHLGTGVETDLGRAAKLYQSSAELGFAMAQCNMGVALEKGIGVKEDPKEAVKWYQLSADQGLDSSLNNLGTCFEKGLGVPKNASKAVEYYAKAVEQDLDLAQYNLARCYHFGLGVEKDLDRATSLYKKAKKQDCKLARDQLHILKSSKPNKLRRIVSSMM